MLKRNKSIIFQKGRISDVFQQVHENIKTAIDNQSESYILNVNETDYIDYLEKIYRLSVPEIHFDHEYVDSYEADIPAENFPSAFYVIKGKKYKKDIIKFFIPVSGDINLLNYLPASSFSLRGGNFAIEGVNLVTEFINFSNDADEIKRNYENEVNGIRFNYNILIKDIENFNNSLRTIINSFLSHRKQQLFNKHNLLSSLGVPLKNKENVPSTFAVPKPQLRDKIIVKPIVRDNGFKPEPTLDNDNYFKILKIINDVGKNFERLPGVYEGKGEEDLRDHILLTLDPNFEFGSASGETFNKTGKTDIQLRYDSSVVFIAECKFWSGEKKYMSTIDQLLGYLTWRDTKSSVIIFVKQKDFSAVIEKVKNETSQHSNFLSFVNQSDENWFNYRFHLNGDRNREVRLAVQLFHLPDNKV
ncbi:MAG: hypothetical protein J0L60_08165 [Ignavibacteria bacterium]|nr:hypothetical protein [Ignavibacteria bacterium]